MRKFLVFFSIFFCIATAVSAAALTEQQIGAVSSLLRSFGVTDAAISRVESVLRDNQSVRSLVTLRVRRIGIDGTRNTAPADTAVTVRSLDGGDDIVSDLVANPATIQRKLFSEREYEIAVRNRLNYDVKVGFCRSDTIGAGNEPCAVEASQFVDANCLASSECSVKITTHQEKQLKVVFKYIPRFPPSGSAATDASYDMNVLVLRYFPFDETGRIIDDSAETAGWALPRMRQSTDDQVHIALSSLEQASRYLGHAFPDNPPALRYHLVADKEYLRAVPWTNETVMGPDRTYLDYPRVLNENDICNYVDRMNVQEVWLFKSQAKNGFEHSESKMSGPHGDISNSYGINEMPKCSKTYRVYTHDLQRDDLFLEVWGHQMEAELRFADTILANSFLSPCDEGYNCHPLQVGKDPKVGRCGNVHNPPNARDEYDRANPAPNKSDCLDWKPDGLGKLTDISCKTWGCSGTSVKDNPTRNFIVWYWQNMPGRKNEKTYQGRQLRNWWDIHGDFDRVMRENRALTLSSVASSPKVSSPSSLLTAEILRGLKESLLRLQSMLGNH